MPKKIRIDGILGWDVNSSEIKQEFEKAANDEIELSVSSPGGSVWEAIGIFNAIRNQTKSCCCY
jgi:ATP-dependent protease ClpP protease subunit